VKWIGQPYEIDERVEGDLARKGELRRTESAKVSKNHYGSKSRRGTEIAAVFYTLLETAKLGSTDPAREARRRCLTRPAPRFTMFFGRRFRPHLAPTVPPRSSRGAKRDDLGAG
jgi:hypothetical protein